MKMGEWDWSKRLQQDVSNCHIERQGCTVPSWEQFKKYVRGWDCAVIVSFPHGKGVDPFLSIVKNISVGTLLEEGEAIIFVGELEDCVFFARVWVAGWLWGVLGHNPND